MTELEHLQQVILSIAKDIDKLCRANNIQYYLLGGSAIGAIRHKGFIPWDDDFDIIMDDANYRKFINVAREQLDPDKYYVCEGLKDWPLYFTKIKLRGTHLKEIEGFWDDSTDGIYIDVFKMDNVPDNRILSYCQYFLAKVYLCFLLSQRTYKSASLGKRVMMAMTFPLKFKLIRNWVLGQIERYNEKPTSYWGFFYGRTRYWSSVIRKDVFGKPTYVPFEDTEFPVAEKYHEYLTQVFGNYMQLPPIEQRKGIHLLSVEFGKY